MNVDLILPLEFSPHAPKLSFSTISWLDVIHDIDVDIVQHHVPSDVRVRRSFSYIATTSGIVDDISEDDASLCRRDFDRRFDRVEGVRSKSR